MTFHKALLSVAIAVFALPGCSLGSRSSVTGEDQPKKWCTASDRRPDSAFMVDQARTALMGRHPSMVLYTDSIAQIGGGLVIRMLPVKAILGGGGLVWVNLETACALVLRKYE